MNDLPFDKNQGNSFERRQAGITGTIEKPPQSISLLIASTLTTDFLSTRIRDSLWFRLIPYFKLARAFCLCQADKDSADLRMSKMVWQLPKVGWFLILMREGRSEIEIEIKIEGGQKLKWPQLRTFSASSPVSLRPFFAPRSVQMSALAEELSSDWPKVLNLSQPYICRNFLGIRPPVIHKMGNWKGVAWEWQPWT